jgi:hypothetical protein
VRKSTRRPAKTRATVSPPFLSLDFLYVPSRDPDREIDYYTRVLGGVAVFRIKAMGTEVAGVRLSQDGHSCCLLNATCPCSSTGSRA